MKLLKYLLNMLLDTHKSCGWFFETRCRLFHLFLLTSRISLSVHHAVCGDNFRSQLCIAGGTSNTCHWHTVNAFLQIIDKDVEEDRLSTHLWLTPIISCFWTELLCKCTQGPPASCSQPREVRWHARQGSMHGMP